MRVDNLKVYWRHVNNTLEDRARYLKAKKEKDIAKMSSTSYTECIIVDEITGEVISARKAFCHPIDNFNKKIGRKKSFEKAVSNIAYPSIRKNLWEELKKVSPKTLKA